MAMEFEREEFEEWLMRGIKISHGINFDPLPDDEIPFLLPTSPVAFAMVNSIDDVIIPPNYFNIDNLTPNCNDKPLMMIPLPLIKLIYKVYLKPFSNCISVTFEACWSVDFIKNGRFCDFFLALPIGPPVEGGAEVTMLVTFKKPILPVDSGMFTIPLSFPFYAKNFPREQSQRTKKCRIRLGLSAREGQVVANYTVNYPLKVVFEEENLIHLYQESEGPHLEWPDIDLHCDYTLAKKAIQPPKAANEEAVESAESANKEAEPKEPAKKKARVTDFVGT